MSLSSSAASERIRSIEVAHALAEVAPESLKLSIVEIGQLPLYNQDGDENPQPEWTAFRERVRSANAVLLVRPAMYDIDERRDPLRSAASTEAATRTSGCSHVSSARVRRPLSPLSPTKNWI
jgi:hypothetical protein